MENLFQELTSLFEQLQQPVLVLDGETLVYQNPASQVQLPLLDAQDAAALTEGPADLGGRRWNVSLKPLAGYRVLTLEAADEAALVSTQVLDVLAQTLRGPLSSAFSASQMLFSRLEEQENPSVRRGASAMNRSFYQMLRLVSNLSDLSQYLQGKKKLQRSAVEINGWMRQLERKLEPICQLRGVQLELQTSGEYCMVSIDGDQLQRALLNLVSNAIKFTPPDGHIVLRLEIGRTQLRFKVLDDGEGMAPEVLDTLYWRALSRSMLGDPRWGVGLGMQLVRQVAIAHGGTVLVERRESGGTCVTVSIERVRGEGGVLCSPMPFDYAGGFDKVLMELADVLPVKAFDPRDIN